jgi:putative membrane protein
MARIRGGVHRWSFPMKSIGPIAAIALALGVPSAVPAVAQSDMMTGRTALSPVSAQDFVSKVAGGTQFELQSAQIAVKKAQNPAIKDLAERLIKDHTKASDDLKQAVASESIVKFPKEPEITTEKERLIKQLQSASGKDFDTKFIEVMADDHREDLNLFRSYESTGTDPEIKGFVRRTLPTIENHLREIEKLQTGGKGG